MPAPTRNVTNATSAQMPSWARVLFEPIWRYISLRGGRGSGKTKNVARSRVLKALEQPLRGLCTREVQDSIKESVYAQIVAEIEEMGVQSEFTILRDEIRPRIGGTMIFKGLNDLSVAAIKSMANIDWCWIEEAQYLSAVSWNKLDPTIRASGSQILLSWNPELETDFIYELIVKKGLPDCADLFINFDQNPWFPEVLRRQEQHMLGTDPVMHRHVWLGMPLPAVPNAIYFNEVAQAEADGRIRALVQDPSLNVYAVFDLGHADFMTCLVVQQAAGEIRTLDFIENNRVAIKWFSDELIRRGYSQDDVTICLPHDGASKSYQTDMSTQELMESYGWTVVIVPRGDLEEGIRTTRERLPRFWFDKAKCERLIEHAKRYQRNKHGHVVHDEHSHACDALRYTAVYYPQMHNDRAGWGVQMPSRRLTIGTRRR